MATAIIVIVILIVVISIAMHLGKRSKQPKQMDIPANVTITTSWTSSPAVVEKFPPAKQLESADVVLNPESPFQLTLQNSSLEIANKIRNILDDEESYDNVKREKIAAIFAEHNLRVKEIEEYKKKYEKVYRTKIEHLKQASEEWKNASELDKKDILQDFRRLSIGEVYEQADCNMATLFVKEPRDITIDDELIKEYGFENINVYLRYADDLQKVRVIPNDNYNRKSFETLVDVGLAIRGASIPKELILWTLKLKELNEIANNPSKIFKRKNQAVEYILQFPDLDKLLGTKISFRELFKLNPLPERYSQIDLEELSDSWNYTYEVVDVLVDTYRRSFESYTTLKEDGQYSKGYKVECFANESGETCPCGKDLSTRNYKLSSPPQIPYHVGCNCLLRVKY